MMKKLKKNWSNKILMEMKFSSEHNCIKYAQSMTNYQ